MTRRENLVAFGPGSELAEAVAAEPAAAEETLVVEEPAEEPWEDEEPAPAA